VGNAQTPHPNRGGRPRKHSDDAARKRAWRKNGDETRDETPTRPPDARRSLFRLVPTALRARLIDAGHRHIDPMADVAPIGGFVDQGSGRASAGRKGRTLFRLVPTEALRARLHEAGQGHIDPMADVEPISEPDRPDIGRGVNIVARRFDDSPLQRFVRGTGTAPGVRAPRNAAGL
jgi:hypothetical protein